MRNSLSLAAMVLAVAFASAAQSAPKVEIFGGYSLLHADPDFVHANASGWEASGTYNFNRFVGATADFSGYYENSTGVNDHNFLFGPTVSAHLPKVTPFGHALFGDSLASGPTNAFAMALGGGMDWNWTEHVAVRIVQADYLMTRFTSSTQNNARFSFGLVVKF